jgi:uncharacterized protein with GYD domain
MEPDHRVADRGQHPLDLVLAALVDRELDPARPEPADARGRSRTVVQLDARAKPLERVVGGLALDLGLVDLLDLVARMREPVRELAVVGEQERSGRVGVQPPDGDDPRGMLDELDDGGPALWVAGGGDHARGLVEEHVGERLELDSPPVELDPVPGGDEGIELPRLAVDADAAGLDQLVGLAAGGDPGAREVGIEPHSRHYSGAVPHYVSLMRWTSQGVAGLPAWRERVEDGERIIEEAGGRLSAVYVTLGRYDVVEIFEAPDDDTAAEILMKLQRHGAEHTETLRAFTRDEAEAIIRRL